MPKIPEYEQRTRASVGGGGELPHNPQQESSGLFALAQAIGGFTDARERVKEEDAAAWATENLSKAQGDWSAQILKRKEEAPQGAPDFVATTLADYDEYSKNLVAQSPTKRSKQFMQERLGVYRVGIQNEAMIFEATSRAEHAVRTVDEATDRKRQVVQVSPEQFESMRGEQEVLINSMRLPEQRRELLKQQANDSLARDAVIGLTNRNPYATLKALNQEPGKSGIAAVEALNADDRLQLRNGAESEIARREAEQRARMVEARNALDTSRDDALAAKAAGLPAQLPGRSLYLAVYPKDGEQRYSQDSQLISTFDAADAAVLLPPDEGIAKIAQFGPVEQEGAAAQAEVQRLAQQLYGKQRAAFEQDPVAHLLLRDQDLAVTFDAIVSGEGTPEQVAQYVGKIRATQEAAGIALPKILPASAEILLARLLQPNPEKPGQRALRFAQLEQQWGRNYPDILRQVVPKLGGMGQILPYVPAHVAARLDGLSANPEPVLAALEKSGRRKDLGKELTSELKKFGQTFPANIVADGPAIWEQYFKAAELLAAEYVRDGMATDNAASQAVDELVRSQYTLAGPLRIPHREDAGRGRAVNAGQVIAGADAAKGTLARTGAFLIEPVPFESPENAQADRRAEIAQHGFWTANPDESGAVLAIPTGVVLGANGRPVTMSWEELEAAGLAEQERLRARNVDLTSRSSFGGPR